jgi:hypothetical protein
MSRKRSERKIERLLAENEACEPLEGLLERLRAEIPPLDKIGGAHLRTALEQRRVRRLPVLWLTAASVAFLMVGGALAVRLWQQVPFAAREQALVEATLQSPQDRQERSDAAPQSSAPSVLSERPKAAIAEPGPAQDEQLNPWAPQELAGGLTGGAPSPALELPRDLPADAAASAKERDLEASPAPEPWPTLTSEPGQLVDRIRAGANAAGQQFAFEPAEAPDGKAGASPRSRPASPPPGPPAPLADERRAAASRGGQSVVSADGTVVTDMAAIGSAPGAYDFDAFEEMQVSAEAPAPGALGGGARRIEAALVPWRRSAPARLVVGLAPSPLAKKGAGHDKDEGFAARSAPERPVQKAEAQPLRRPALAISLRFEPAAVVRARWLGEEAWREPGHWEYLAAREAAGKSSRLEVELRAGVGAEQIVALARFPETVRPRPLRLAELTRGWESASWELRAAVVRSELEAGIEGEGAGLSSEELSTLLARAREVEAAQPDDPRAKKLEALARRLKASSPRQ